VKYLFKSKTSQITHHRSDEKTMQNFSLKEEVSIWDLELVRRISSKHILESVGVIDCTFKNVLM
jgi:hypothetical protein